MCNEKHYDRVVHELICKWKDASLAVKSNLTRCLAKILISKLEKPAEAVGFLNRLNQTN